MTRYFTKSGVFYQPEEPAWDYDDEPAGGPSIDVHIDDEETFTGLLDRRGNEIHRSERIPLGFQVEPKKEAT